MASQPAGVRGTHKLSLVQMKKLRFREARNLLEGTHLGSIGMTTLGSMVLSVTHHCKMIYIYHLTVFLGFGGIYIFFFNFNDFYFIYILYIFILYIFLVYISSYSVPGIWGYIYIYIFS